MIKIILILFSLFAIGVSHGKGLNEGALGGSDGNVPVVIGPLTTFSNGINVSGGNVGIGTTSPGTILHIAGTTPIVRLGQSSDCETLTPGAVGEICAQNSATCPIKVSTGTAVGQFACLSLGTQ